MNTDAVVWTLIGVGAVAQVVAWRLVVAGRISVWSGTGVLMGLIGALSLATGREHLSPKVDVVPAAAAGLASGVALFAATRVFVRVVSSWGAFQRDTAALYRNRSSLSLPVALFVAVGLSAPGEELFWRGLAAGRLTPVAGIFGAAAIALGGYAGVLAASELLPIMAGAVVGGGLWSLLFVWTGGVVAGIASHVAFTGLMLVLPPRTSGSRVRPGARVRGRGGPGT